MGKPKQSIIQFNKAQTSASIKYLIHAIATIANHGDLPKDIECLVNDLSTVLTVMRKCHDVAPDTPNILPELV